MQRSFIILNLARNIVMQRIQYTKSPHVLAIKSFKVFFQKGGEHKTQTGVNHLMSSKALFESHRFDLEAMFMT